MSERIISEGTENLTWQNEEQWSTIRQGGASVSEPGEFIDRLSTGKGSKETAIKTTRKPTIVLPTSGYSNEMASLDKSTDSTKLDRRLPSFIGGIACRLPKSDNVEMFWENLMGKVDMIDETRWPPGMYNLPPRSGTLRNLGEFDNCFFDISPDEVIEMPCMLRLLLEVIYECIVDSGIPRQTLAKSRAGLYLAINFCEDQELNRGFGSRVHVNTKSEFIHRIFSILGLSGPASSVDTACCSSISAIQMANMDLYLGRCDYAIVAGANLLENLNHSMQFFKLGMLSPNGQSMPFDTNANGYVRSEGIVAMLLSSRMFLHRVYAKIDNVLCVCDGYKERGILSPSEKDQLNLLQNVYQGRYPIYVEAHATGTTLGDETELKGLKKAFGDKLKEPLFIGSCKSNLGHTEACAGLVSLLKCVLSIHHGVIPPNINLTSPHPLLTESNPWAKAVTQETKLPSGYIGVSSFGFGGVIGHVILERLPHKIIGIPKYVLLPLRLHDENQFNKIIKYVDENKSDIKTLSLMSTASFCLASKPDIIGYVNIFKDDMDFDINTASGDNPIWLILNDVLFTDQSILNEDLFHIEFIHCSFKKYESILCSKGSDVHLSKIIFMEENKRRFKDKFLLNAAIQIALLDLLMLCKFKPDKLLGIGLSEIIVAYCDGCICLKTCLHIFELIATYFDEKIGGFHEDKSPVHIYWQPETNKTLCLKLKNILRPKERSGRWVSSLNKEGITLKDHRQFGFNYLNHLLRNPVDISGVKVPEEASMFLFNGDKRLESLALSEAIKITYCHPNCSSVLSTLGSLHLLTENIDITQVNPDVFPLDHTTPPIGHLLDLNRECWTAPNCLDFCKSIKNQLVTSFPVKPHSEIYEPMSILITNVIEMLEEPPSVISVNATYIAEFDETAINNAFIGIHQGLHKISVSRDDDLFLGFYNYLENLPENLLLDNETKDSQSPISWYGSLIDFVNSTYKLGCNTFNSEPYGFLYDQKYQNGRIAEDYNVNIEYETGICQAGGLIFRFKQRCISEAQTIENQIDNTLVTCIFLYDISQQTEAYVIIYTGYNEDETQHYIGVCLLADEYEFVQKQIKVPSKLDLKDLSKVLPYLISYHLLNDILAINKKQTLVIHPQYDSLSMFIAMIAKDLCQHVYLCCWGEEIANELQVIIPEVTVVSVQNLNNFLRLSKGRGFDAAIKLSSSDLSKSLLSLADHGRMVICDKPDLFEDLKLGVFLKNITLKVTDPLTAVTNFLSSDESWEENLMTIMSSESLNELCDYSFLQGPNSVYEVMQNSELSKVRLSTLLPYLNLTTVAEPPLSPEDERFVKNLAVELDDIVKKMFPAQLEANLAGFQHNTYCVQNSEVGTPTMTLEAIPIIVVETPTFPMEISTPSQTAIASLRQTKDKGSIFVWTPPRSFSSTKLGKFIKDKQVIVPLNSVETVNCPPLIFIHPITGVISQLKKLASLLSVPCYGIQMTSQTPRTSVPNMASFYIQELFEKFPEGPYRLAGYSFGACVALEMAIQLQAKVELLLLLDGSPKYVRSHCEYIQEEISEVMTNELLTDFQSNPSNRLDDFPDKVELQEIGYMLRFAKMYKEINKEMGEEFKVQFYSTVIDFHTREERIDFLLDLLQGEIFHSVRPAKMNWLRSSLKMLQQKPRTPDIFSTTSEVIRASKAEKLINYLDNCKIGQNYIPETQFIGPIHLLRIKDEPMECLPVPTDYGVSDHCSDTFVQFYDGNHKTFLNEFSLHENIESLLRSLKESVQ